MNQYYTKFKENKTVRTPIFQWVADNILDYVECPSILEIGAIRPNNLDPDLSLFSDGYSSFFWAEYLDKRNCGKLTIVDIDTTTVQNAKYILENFVNMGVQVEFVCDDGMNWVNKDGFSLVYLDGPDNIHLTYEMYKKIPRLQTAILCDDANFSPENLGKCYRLRQDYPNYKLFKLENTAHEMILYPKIIGNNEQFKIGKLELNYFRGNHGNREYVNERSVEIALGDYFYNKFNNQVVELGAVMPTYRYTVGATIVDPYDPYPGCVRVDGLEYDYTNQNVFSCSSIEHIANDTSYDKQVDLTKAIKVLEKIVQTAKNYLITWPIGAHSGLDNYLKTSTLPYTIMRRENVRDEVNNWIENKNLVNFDLPYGHFEYCLNYYGNALCIAVVSNLSEFVS